MPAGSAGKPLQLVERGSVLYEAILGREIDAGAREALASRNEDDGVGALAMQLIYSSEFLDKLSHDAVDAHLYLIHRAREIMVRRLLPPAASIIDLGGINAPLFRMGYAHPFKQMVIVDLPADERHMMYRDLQLNAPAGSGEIVVDFCDMTLLNNFADDTFDLVWSGQSIEHVEPIHASRMCREAFRILRPGGHFCLDTPNREITKIHTQDCGGGFVHPDHRFEYRASELRDLLVQTGFEIVLERGVCEMPQTRSTGRFHYEDFVLGNAITHDPEDGYILFFQGQKRPVSIADSERFTDRATP